MLLEVCYELKAESDYEGVNFESKRTQYELVKYRFCEQYPIVAEILKRLSTKEELNLKRKINFEKSDIEFNTGLQKVLKTMDIISGAIQRSVGILAHLVHHQKQFHTPQMPSHNQVLSNG